MLAITLKNILHSPHFSEMEAMALQCNKFFTLESIHLARRAIETQFLDNPTSETNTRKIALKVGIICAGNIPLVGFSDMYFALVSGSEVYLKPSRRDPLMRVFAPICHIVEEIPKDVDLILAMGGNQTMQSIVEKYHDKQLVLRGSMHSVSVLRGDESEQDLKGLADDIFTHSSMGCRSVSHLFLPLYYDMSKLSFAPRTDLPTAWYSNYKYQKATSTMRGDMFVDCGFYILKEGHHSDIGVLGYTFYSDLKTLDLPLEQIQCVVANDWLEHERRVDFSRAQFPRPTDFANGEDVLTIIRNHNKE